MLAALARRAATGLAVVAGVVTLTFFLLRLAPGDPVELLLGPAATPAQIAAQRHALAFDRPLATQYAAWLGRFARGEWGTLLSYLLGVAVGAVQATARPRVDTALSVATVTLFAVPGYWLGLMLVMVFTYWARALPAFGRAGLDGDLLVGGPWLLDRLRHLVLPLATLTLIGIGGIARFVRAAMLEVVGQPFVRCARAKGLAPFAVVRRHVARNALIPVAILLGLSFPALFSGGVFVEFVFAWP
ncbi:MAG: hypothetical protein AUH34_01900, partial [Gemmatimonadetes bacterium 13_1_40CM_70_12]